MSIDVGQEAHQYHGFYYDPNEKYSSLNEVLNSNEFNKLDGKIEKGDLLKKWMLISYEDIPHDFISVPFVNDGYDSI
ncbi:MAG: hypothetical protein VR72_00145 [Clostridiaceae bacterium BRH_c20a]|nr:MAG: hypothetical protein VR72_00145 [Clostridiaceae bacterium BRH_c20a]